MEKDTRQRQLNLWSKAKISAIDGENSDYIWTMVSGDASFRRYFRWANDKCSYIAVDAPPEHENNPQFVNIANMLDSLNAPKVLAYDFEQGFMLLSDLGDQLFLPLLNDQTADGLYRSAIDALIDMQAIKGAEQLPPYDQTLLMAEMELFREWFIGKHLQLELSPQEHQMLDQLFDKLIDSALQQPQVFVHRDYHSRNIMYRADQAPGIIDFQDAVYGPITYDLLSLLRDCYIQWPVEKVQGWLDYYLQHTAFSVDKEQFSKWFDWMGLQRHIKVAGIFARLNYRDGKSGYLKDIPLTLTYIVQQAEKYPELEPFSHWMREKILPEWGKKRAVTL